VSRIPLTSPAELDGERRALYDAIAGGPRAAGPQHFALTAPDGALLGPFNAFLLAPALGDALQRLGAAVRYETSLPPRIREGAILLVAARWDCAFERHAHEAVGRSAGLTDQELETLTMGEVPGSGDAVEVAALRLAKAIAAGDVSDEQWAEWTPPLGERTVFELTTLVGYYAALALQLRVFRVGVDG
jgi:4-carboxymuconolactone decarboxylase